jgi:hypothetical protein
MKVIATITSQNVVCSKLLEGQSHEKGWRDKAMECKSISSNQERYLF